MGKVPIQQKSQAEYHIKKGHVYRSGLTASLIELWTRYHIIII